MAIFHTPEHIARYCSDTASSDTEDNGDKDGKNDQEKERTAEAAEGNDVGVPMDTDSPVKKKKVRSAFPLATLHCGGVGVDSDTVWNPETTSKSARLAVGQVLCLAHK